MKNLVMAAIAVAALVVLISTLRSMDARRVAKARASAGRVQPATGTDAGRIALMRSGRETRLPAAASNASSSPTKRANAQAVRHPLGDELRAAIAHGGDAATAKVEEFKGRAQGRPIELLEAMRVEEDASVAMVLGMMLAENGAAMADPAVIAALREMTKHPVYTKRQAALAALSFAPELSPDMIAEVTALSRDDVSPEVRISAIATMSVWMEKHPATVESMSRELMVTAQANSDDTIRGHAIQLVANQNVKLPDDVVKGMVYYLSSEKVPENRQLAALGVGGATGTMLPGALSALEGAYTRETHQDTKRVILMQMVRASGANAPGILARLPATDTVLQNDISDYRDLLAKGITDPNEMWTQKSLLDARRGTEVGMNYEEHHNHNHSHN